MPTILVVDDERSIGTFLGEALEEEGYVVHLAGNGHEALQVLNAMRVDLILSDVMMPIMDGTTLLTTVRTTPALRAIPVIMMSAAADVPAVALTLSTTFLPKPFAIDSMLDAITQALTMPSDGFLPPEAPSRGSTLSA